MSFQMKCRQCFMNRKWKGKSKRYTQKVKENESKKRRQLIISSPELVLLNHCIINPRKQWKQQHQNQLNVCEYTHTHTEKLLEGTNLLNSNSNCTLPILGFCGYSEGCDSTSFPSRITMIHFNRGKWWIWTLKIFMN